MTRIFIDWDGDGAFVSITRTGMPAEEIRLSEREVVRLLHEAAGASLRTTQRLSVTPARWPSEERLEPLIGHFGE